MVAVSVSLHSKKSLGKEDRRLRELKRATLSMTLSRGKSSIILLRILLRSSNFLQKLVYCYVAKSVVECGEARCILKLTFLIF
jgi:hypothetical protein